MFPKPIIDFLPSFGNAITPEAVQATINAYPSGYVIATILELSDYLISLGQQSTIFGISSHDPFSPGLRTLHDRLHNGQLTPSPLQSHANQEKRARETLSQRTAKAVTNRPLEDFEDLYYAVISRMLDVHQTLNVRLGSGFNTLMDLVMAGGPTIASLHENLARYWDVLNTAEYVKAIDDAVRRSRIKHLHQEILLQVQHDEITQSDADELLADLYDPGEYDGVQGLAWIGGWAPSMIGAWLEEKYRIVLSTEREMEQTRSRNAHRKSKAATKSKQPKALRTPKEDLRVAGSLQEIDKPVEDVSIQVHQQQIQPYETLQGRELQEQLEYALEWQIKAQRVEQYSQYLRNVASQNARHMVQSTVIHSDKYLGRVSGMDEMASHEDTEMSNYEF